MTALFVYLLEVSVCLIAFFGLYHVVLKNDTFFQVNRMYLLVSTGLSFLIPILHVTIIKETLVSSSAIMETNSTINEVVPPAIDGYTWLFLLYLVGLLYFVVKFLFNLISISQLIRSAEIEHRPGYKMAHIDSKLPVFSFLGYIFWSTELCYDEQESEQIIKHEQVHINQRHSIDLMFLELVNIVLWFNPIVHLYKRNLKIIHEYIADEDLYQTQNYQYEYLDLLIRESKKQQQFTLPVVHTFYNDQLKKRLIMIKNINRQSNKFKICFGLPLLGALMLCFSFETITVVTVADDNDSSTTMQMDTLPIDTVYFFDPVKKKETVRYVTRLPEPAPKKSTLDNANFIEDPASVDQSKYEIDTLITFDPKTYKETIRFIKREKQ